MTAGTGSDIGSSGWTAGIGSPGIRSFGSTAGTASIWQGSGLRVNWYDRGHWVRHWIVWLDSGKLGHQASCHFGLTAGPASSGKAVGSESTGTTVSTGSSGYRIVWLDSGHPGHQASGHLARQRAPDQVPGSSGSTAGIESTGLIGSSGWTSSSCWVEASG
ncbi:unnamed protein product, partial [Staurois parvus]